MIGLLLHLVRLCPFLFGGHRQLALENLALRQQLAVYKRTATRPKLRNGDRLFWAWLSRVWTSWRTALVIVTPEHGTSLAAAPLPRLLDDALRPAHGGAAARPRGDQSPGRPNGRREPLVGRS